MPTGGLFGTSATDLFCTGVAVGSRGLVRLLRNPVPTLLAVGVLLGLLILVAVRATWTPVAPLRIGRRRTWGQIFSASGRMYVKRARLFLGLGLLLIPVAFLITLLQWLLFKGIGYLGAVTGNLAGTFAFLAVIIGATLALMGLVFVQAATACALVEIDAGRQVGALDAFRLAARRLRPLLRTSALFVAAWIVLTTTTILIPVAVWLVIRWSLLAPVVELEDRSGIGSAPSQRSARPLAMDPGQHARRAQRGGRAGRRPAHRRRSDLPDGRAAASS